MAKNSKITVQNTEITIIKIGDEDYLSLTDMVKAKEDEIRAADIIKNWIRNRGTVEFLGTWEIIYNPNFKVVEFDHFKKSAGLATFTMSVTNWVESTNAIGIVSKKGKYGGTYAHKDIAFEFGSAISPIFKLYTIREYQRLKEIEQNQYGLEWNLKRILAKVNYQIHSDAVKNYIIPTIKNSQKKEWIYAEEADMLNIIVFGCTAKEWRDENPGASKDDNIRSSASINDLKILINLESLNAVLIKNKMKKEDRFRLLSDTANEQRSLLGNDLIKSIKKTSDSIYIDIKIPEKNKEK